MVDLVQDAWTNLVFSGADAVFTAPVTGILSLRLWGGGGGGGRSALDIAPSGINTYGGGGGFLSVEIPVEQGDEIVFKVGGGGARGVSGAAGLGGWPDGGHGGRASNSSQWNGGGGGSTSVWVNGVVKAVAGGGGGAGIDERGRAGGGGGETGADAIDPLLNGGGTGGTQTAGGVNKRGPTITSYHGGLFKGGNGWTTGVLNNTTANAANGPGGGGGYYGGGGGGWGSTENQGGGGGAGYVTPDAIFPYFETAPGREPGGLTDPRYPGGGVGYGGTVLASATNGTAGSPGYISYFFAEAVLAIGDPLSPISLTAPEGSAFNFGSEIAFGYEGAAREIVVGSDGTLVVRAWGAGGGAGFNQKGASTNGAGASGGFAYAWLQVDAGDVVKIEVGQGGRGAGTYTGGWPDGGAGSPGGVAGSDYYAGGGGGGSTRVYINDELQVVAGAGGGGWGPYTSTANQIRAGGGGGLNGGDGYARAGADGPSKGGSQTAGGVNPGNPTNGPGGYLQGGTATGTGGGGGGGYYGGSGGNVGGGVTFGAGGGGGSSWGGGARVVLFETEQGLHDAGLPGGSDDPKWPGTVGRGGLNNTTQPTNPGQNGYVHLMLDGLAPGAAIGGLGDPIVLTVPTVSTGVPGFGNGDIPDLTLTSPEAGVLVGVPVGDVGSIIFLESIDGDAFVTGAAEGDIPDLEWRAELGGMGSIEAVVHVPVVDYDIMVEALLDASLSGEVNVQRAMPGPLRFTPPRVYFEGVAPGDPFENDIVLTAVEADADGAGVDATAEFDSVILLELPMTATAAGNARAYPNMPNGPSNGVFAAMSFSAPTGFVSSGDADAAGDLGEITLTAPLGFAEEGVEAFADLTAEITLTSDLSASAVGQGRGTGTIGVISVTAPQPSVTAGAYLNVPVEAPTISLSAPGAITIYGVTVLGSILPARISLRRPAAIASDGEIVLAVGGLEDTPLLLTAPEAGAIMIPEVRFDPILLREPDGYVENGDPAQAPLRFKRTDVAGRVPDEVREREIVLNEADGVLFTRREDGSTRQTPYGALQAGGFAPEGGSEGQILGSDRLWADLQPAYAGPVRLAPPVNAAVPLLDAPAGTGSVALAKNVTFYRPFFVPKQVRLDRIGFRVQQSNNAAYVEVQICRWNFDGTPGESLVARGFPGTNVGLNLAVDDVTLEPGWYAGVIRYLAIGTLTFEGAKAPLSLDAGLNLVGDYTAPFNDPGEPLVAPTGRAASAWGLVYARFVP